MISYQGLNIRILITEDKNLDKIRLGGWLKALFQCQDVIIRCASGFLLNWHKLESAEMGNISPQAVLRQAELAMRRNPASSTPPWSWSLLQLLTSGSWPSSIPSLTSSLTDWLGYINQINSFFPKLLLAMIFITAIERKLEHNGREIELKIKICGVRFTTEKLQTGISKQMSSQWLTGILEPAADTCGYSSMDQCRLAPLREAVLF